MAQVDADYWLAQVQAQKRNELANVQKAASAWSTLFAAILGVFGTAAFAGGLTTLDKFDDPWNGGLKAATVVAAVLILLATVFTGMASFTWPRPSSNSTWQNYRQLSHERAGQARTYLNCGLGFGIAAASLTLAGSVFVLLIPEKQEAPTKPPYVMAVVSGRAVCGRLTQSGRTLTVANVDLATASSVTIVPACPGSPAG